MSVTHKPTTVDNDRVIRLSAYLHGLADPDINGMALFHIYQEDLEKVTPHEVMELLNREYQSGMTADQILTFLDKAINAFGQGLRHYPATQPSPLTFLDLIDSERILGQQAEDSFDSVEADETAFTQHFFAQVQDEHCWHREDEPLGGDFRVCVDADIDNRPAKGVCKGFQPR
jgi:hypothetical protein